MPQNEQKCMFGVTVLLLAAIPLLIRVVAPHPIKLSSNFSHRGDVVPLDNLHNEKALKFAGEIRPVTKFSYQAIQEKQGVLTTKNILAVEPEHGIDREIGKHVLDFGNRDRGGYLFAPHRLKKGEPFTYWHSNYDHPASE